MKLLYLTTWDFTNEQADGVCKKIRSQISVFENYGYEVDIILIRNGKVIYRECGKEREIAAVGSVKKAPAYFKMYQTLKNKKYDWVYNRYGMMDTFYYRVLKRLHQNGARILVEIPTYPYIHEIPKGILYSLMILWDKLYINKLSDCVERIATYSLHEQIYGIKTINIKNGIDFSLIKIKEEKTEDGTLDLIGVAHLSKWHAYDRVIKGLHEYYTTAANETIINFHIVGTGDSLQEYENLVREYELQNHVIFYGNKCGDELDEIYNRCDLAVSSLGLHRIGIKDQASVLKSREYAAKGMPMISSILIDVFKPEDFKYICYFPEDETPINIEKILNFYSEISKSKQDIRHEIREYAYSRCDKSVVMMPIINYMKEKENE